MYLVPDISRAVAVAAQLASPLSHLGFLVLLTTWMYASLGGLVGAGVLAVLCAVWLGAIATAAIVRVFWLSLRPMSAVEWRIGEENPSGMRGHLDDRSTYRVLVHHHVNFLIKLNVLAVMGFVLTDQRDVGRYVLLPTVVFICGLAIVCYAFGARYRIVQQSLVCERFSIKRGGWQACARMELNNARVGICSDP